MARLSSPRIVLLAACLSAACYSEPSTSGDGSETGSSSAPGTGSGDDDGATMSTSTSGSPPGTGSAGSSGEPGSTGPAPGDSSGPGSDESTGPVVGTTSDGSSSSGGLETSGDGSSSDDATTGPVVPPGQCNEMLGVACGADQFCDYPDDMCGAGQHGTCQPQPQICNLILQPSCGCNGSNYSNPCVATSNGTDFAHFGNC